MDFSVCTSNNSPQTQPPKRGLPSWPHILRSCLCLLCQLPFLLRQNCFPRVTSQHLATKSNELVSTWPISITGPYQPFHPPTVLSVHIGQDGTLHFGWGAVTAAHIHGPEQSSPREPGSTVLLHTQEGYNWTIGEGSQWPPSSPCAHVLHVPGFSLTTLSHSSHILLWDSSPPTHITLPKLSLSSSCLPPQDHLIQDHSCSFFEPL